MPILICRLKFLGMSFLALALSACGGGIQSTTKPNGVSSSSSSSSGQLITIEDRSAEAIDDLERYLITAPSDRSAIKEQPFSQISLTQDDADMAQQLIWQDRMSSLLEERQKEVANKQITLAGYTLKYETRSLGDANSNKRSLFISMHGGGATTKQANDQQWQNQINLSQSYAPKDALWVAPRAPTDTWNMWFQGHITPLFDRLITNMIVFENIDPNRIYLTGYSAGGDGAYQLAPRIADRWAGVQMSAGHPNGVFMDNVRNLAFALHVGGNDTAFNRHLEAQKYGDILANLQSQDAQGYRYQATVHVGLGHWMNLKDTVAIPFLQSYTRNPEAKKVVWTRFDTEPKRSYWLANKTNTDSNAKLLAEIHGNTIELIERTGFNDLTIYLRKDMIDFSMPIKVVSAGQVLYEGSVEHTIQALYETLEDRDDPALLFTAKVSLDLK